jgi:transposase
MESTTLNPTQLYLLQMFARNGDEERLKEVKEVLCKHFNQKMEEELEKVWEEKGMTNEMLDEALNTHYRTPYNKQ